jgi:hypothetical protein
MKFKILLLLLSLAASVQVNAQTKKKDDAKKKSSPYIDDKSKKTTKKPKPEPVKQKAEPAKKTFEAPKSAEELEKRRAEIKEKEILERKEAEAKKAKAMKEMSFAQELATSSMRASSGFRLGVNLMQFPFESLSTVRLGELNTPVVEGGKILRDELVGGAVAPGFNGALFFRLSKGSFYVQPEVLFQTKGGKIMIKNNGATQSTSNIRFGSVEVPIMFGIRSRALRFTTGPSIGYNFTMGSGLNDFAKKYSATIKAEDKLVKQFGLGYNAGIGYEKNRNIFDFRLNMALQQPVSMQLGTESVPAELNLRPRVFQFSFGRIF